MIMNSKMVPRAAAVGLHCFASNGWPPCGRRDENCADFVFKSDELLCWFRSVVLRARIVNTTCCVQVIKRNAGKMEDAWHAKG